MRCEDRTLVVRLHYSGLFAKSKLYRQAVDCQTATGKLAALTMREEGERGELEIYFGVGLDADVQASWFRMLDEGIELSRKVTDARRKLATESAMVKMSVADPRNPIDVAKYDGELVSKEVTVNATLRQPNGETSPHTYMITMQRALLKGEKGDITGRWVITSLKDAAAPAGTKTS